MDQRQTRFEINFNESNLSENNFFNQSEDWERGLANLEFIANLDSVNKNVQTKNLNKSFQKNEGNGIKSNTSKHNPLLDSLLENLPCSNRNLNVNNFKNKGLVDESLNLNEDSLNKKSDFESEFESNQEDQDITNGKNLNNNINLQKNCKLLNNLKKIKKRKTNFMRKNITKIQNDEKLSKEILNARKEEEQRINRIIEQHQIQKKIQHEESSKHVDDIILSSDDEKLEIIEISDEEEENKITTKTNSLFQEIDITNSGLHTDDSLNVPDKEGKVLVNVGHPLSDPDIYLIPFHERNVKTHQIGGIRFLYDCIIENLTKIKTSDGIGCILAHSMGLGKSLQTICFIEVFLRVTSFKYVLCIVPLITIQNWISEFDLWLPKKKNEFFNNSVTDCINNQDNILESEKNLRNFSIYALTDMKTFVQRSNEILNWRQTGGVLFIGYEMFRVLLDDNDKLNNRKSKKHPYENLSKDYYLELLEKVKQALTDPGPDLVICDEGHKIKNAKASTSKALKQIRTKRRIILTGYPLQNNLIEYWCMVDFIRPGYLGTKQDFSNMFDKPISNGNCVDSTDYDRNLMRKRAHVLHKLLRGFVQRRSYIILENSLPKKYEYVILVRMTAIQKELLLAFFKKLQVVNDPFNSVVDKTMKNNPLFIYSVCYKIWNHPDILNKAFKDGLIVEDMEINKTSKLIFDYDWALPYLSNYKTKVLENSMKMVILFGIIKESIKVGDRLLIFSQSLLTLDIIEQFLNEQFILGNQENFKKNINYFRLDGSTSAHDRKVYIDTFNKNKSFYLFLLSTKAGSLGVNLTGANRIVIFDASWNPCHDAQATCRIYRYGQKKECFIYRLIFDNSLEKKIFDRQISKQNVSNRVVDEMNTDINLTWNEVNSLVEGLEKIEEPPIFNYENDNLNEFKDDLIKKICKEFNTCITKKPFEHKSFYIDSLTTKLSKKDKQIAEHEYNIVKNRKNNFLNTNFQNYNQNNYPIASTSLNTYNSYYNNLIHRNLNQNFCNFTQMNQNIFNQNHFSNSSNHLLPINTHNSFTENSSNYIHSGPNILKKPYNKNNFNNLFINNQKDFDTKNDDVQFDHSIHRVNKNIINFSIPQDLEVPDDNGEILILRKNQVVQLIPNNGSVILKTHSGKQVSLRGNLVNFSNNNHTKSNNIIFQHNPIASTSKPEPELISLSDED